MSNAFYCHRHTGGAATYHLVVKVRGLAVARRVGQIMTEETGRETPYDVRGEETERLYWVSNTYLEPKGEQRVLEYLAENPGHLLYVAGGSHRLRPRRLYRRPGRVGRRLPPRIRDRLAEQARQWPKLDDYYTYGGEPIRPENASIGSSRHCFTAGFRYRKTLEGPPGHQQGSQSGLSTTAAPGSCPDMVTGDAAR